MDDRTVKTMAHFLTTPFKKPVLRVFALSLVLTVAMPSPAHALRKQQVQDSPPAAALLLSGLEEGEWEEGELELVGFLADLRHLLEDDEADLSAVSQLAPPPLIRRFFQEDPPLREPTLEALNETVREISRRLRDNPTENRDMTVLLRKLQAVMVRYLMSTWNLSEEAASDFAADDRAYQGNVWSMQILGWKDSFEQEKTPAGAGVLDFDSSDAMQHIGAYLMLELTALAQQFDDPHAARQSLIAYGAIFYTVLRAQARNMHLPEPRFSPERMADEIKAILAEWTGPEVPLRMRIDVLREHHPALRNAAPIFNAAFAKTIVNLGYPDIGNSMQKQVRNTFQSLAHDYPDYVIWRPAGLDAGLEEPQPPQGPRLSRRTLLRWAGAATAAGLGTAWFGWRSRERFLEPQEVPEPWKQLFQPKEGAKPLPFLGDDYFRFQISSLHLDAGYRAFDRDGKELGSTDATRGDYQRIVDPRTGETLGYYRMPVQWGLNLGVERFVLKDGAGGEMMTVSVYPYVQKGAVLTKGIPPTAIEGVPPEWRDPERLKTEPARPIYRVFEDEKHQVGRVEMIGYVETAADRPGRLLDAAKRPIARLEPVQIIYAGQSPQMLQPLDIALASWPGNNRYFTEAPSEKLTADLSDALDRFQPVTPDGRKGKLQLAHRWVQLQVLLGKRTVAVDPRKARETGEALVKWSTAELEDFKNPEVRRLLWDAIANFHPWFAMAREAARHLGWEEDPKILRYVLSQIQQWWIGLENPKRNALSDGDGQMTDLTKDVLEEVLLYNGFQTLDDVADGFKTFLGGSARLSREFLYIDQPKGSDPALVPLSLMQARLKGFRDVSDVQILLHQAVALQRLGYQVSFLSYVPVANGLEKEEPVKTLSHEWVIMGTHPDHQNEAILFSTHREFLKRFGEEILPGAGVTRVTRERILEVNQTLPPGFYLSMEEYSLFPLDASAYLKARDQALKRRKTVSSAELLEPGLGLAVESEGEFYQQFEQDLASAYVRAMAQRFDEIAKETGIKVVTSGLTGSELEVRKAGYGAALGLIPRKLIRDLEKIVFLRETKIVPSREARVENGRVIWENVDLEAEGTYSGKTIESVKGVSTPVHEIVHHWDVHVTDQVHDWRGDLSELFHQISWQRNNGQGSWALRKTTDLDMRDFADRGHGLANEKEDIAVNGEQYVMNGAVFRSDARIAMSGGNYAPAVKYLFARYLLFLDTDGTSFEYSVGSGSPALTWSEVTAAIRTDSEGLNPKPEAKRLGALVERMREVWLKQRESGKIVQRAAEAPLLAAAGMEEGVSPQEFIDTADLFYQFPEIFRSHFANKIGLVTRGEWNAFVSDVREKDPASAERFARLPLEEIQRPHGNLLRHKPTGKGFLITAEDEGFGKSLYSAVLVGSAQTNWTQPDSHSPWEYQVDDSPVVFRTRDRVVAGFSPHWKPGRLTTRYPLRGRASRPDGNGQYVTRIPENRGFLVLTGVVSLGVGKPGDLGRAGNHWQSDVRKESSGPDLVFGKVAQRDSIPHWSGMFVRQIRQMPLFGVHVEGNRTPQAYQPTIASLNEWASRAVSSAEAADRAQKTMEQARRILLGQDPLANFVRPAERNRLRSSWIHYQEHRISLGWTGVRPLKPFNPSMVLDWLEPIERRRQDYLQGKITWENLPLLSAVLVQLSRFPGGRVPLYAASTSENSLRRFASDPGFWDAAQQEIPSDRRQKLKKIFRRQLAARVKRDNDFETLLFLRGAKTPATRPTGPEGNLRGGRISEEILDRALDDIATAVRNLPPGSLKKPEVSKTKAPGPANGSAAAAPETLARTFHRDSMVLINAWIRAAGPDQTIGNGTKVWVQDNLAGNSLQNDRGVTLRRLRDRVAEKDSWGITGAWFSRNPARPARIWVRDLKRVDRWLSPAQIQQSIDRLHRIRDSKPFFSAVVKNRAATGLALMDRKELLDRWRGESSKVADKMWGLWAWNSILNGEGNLPKVIGYRADPLRAVSSEGKRSPTLSELVDQVNRAGAGLSVERFEPDASRITLRMIYPDSSTPNWPYQRGLVRYLGNLDPFSKYLDQMAERQTAGLEEQGQVSIEREFDLNPQMHLNPVQHVWQVMNEIEKRFPGLQFEFSLWKEGQWQAIGRVSFVDFLGEENRWDDGKRMKVVLHSGNPLLHSADLDFFAETITYILTSQDGVSREKESMDFSQQVQGRLGVRYGQISGRTTAIAPVSVATAGLEEPTAGPMDDEIQQWVQGVKSATADEAKSTSVLLGWLDLPDSEPVPVSLATHEPVDPRQPWFAQSRFLSEATESLDQRIARSERAHRITRRVLEEAQRKQLDTSAVPPFVVLWMRLQTDLLGLTQHATVVSLAIAEFGKVSVEGVVAQELLAGDRGDATARSRNEEQLAQVQGVFQKATGVLERAGDVNKSLDALLDLAGVREGPNWVNLREFLTSDGSYPSAGLEEGRGYVLVEGVGMLAPPNLPAERYYVVAIGIEQAAALIQAGRAPGRIIAVATGLEEVSGLAALGIPGDQIVQAWDWPTLEAAKNYAVRLGREWLTGLGGLEEVSVLEVTARSLQGILAQLREMLPSGWQMLRPIGVEDAERTLDLAV